MKKPLVVWQHCYFNNKIKNQPQGESLSGDSLVNHSESFGSVILFIKDHKTTLDILVNIPFLKMLSSSLLKGNKWEEYKVCFG